VRIPAKLQNAPNRGSYLAETYELRITGRCLEEDLGVRVGTPFEDLLNEDIVRGFVGKRGSSRGQGEEFTGHGTGRTLYKLGFRDQRGTTWYDEDEEVVWLLACRRHRSGAPDDAYPYMEQLGTTGRLLPTAGDYEALFDDRDDRAAEVVVEEAADLLTQARDEPGVEKTGVLGHRAPVSVVVELTDGIEEVCIAFSVAAVPAAWVMLIPVWFLPRSHFDQWMETAAFPTRALEEGEICLRWVEE
jgi:hypothetical protein